MIYIENINFGGALQKNELVIQFHRYYKIMFLFHLQRLGAERKDASFLNY